jgi:galactoside 2-L-fucosyltransferase 1/2
MPSKLIMSVLGAFCLWVAYWLLLLGGAPDNNSEQWVAVVTRCQLGNVLWELASAHGIASARRARLCVIDADGYYAQYRRHIVWTGAVPLERSCPGWAVVTPWFQFLPHFLSVFRRCAVHSSDYVAAPSPKVMLQGCLQSYKYFTAAPFRLTAQASAKEWVQHRNLTVAIHVRRGDKLTDTGNIVPPAHYFYMAWQGLQDRFPEPKRSAVVVTDDEAWVRAHPLFKDMHVLNTPHNPAFDMAVIAACRHKILSIGTFGWWGAYLGDPGHNTTTAVIYPIPQMLSKEEFNHRDFFPPHWTPLSYAHYAHADVAMPVTTRRITRSGASTLRTLKHSVQHAASAAYMST